MGEGDAAAMSGNVRPKGWSARHERAVELVADDHETDEAIAAEVGITDRTLRRWKDEPYFAGRVALRRAELAEAIRAEGLAKRENRLAGYQDRYDRLQRVIDERAADPSMATIPGGTTGLLLRETKFIKMFSVALDEEGNETGPATPLKLYAEVQVYTVDTGTVRQMDNTARQAAQDLGQWVTKGEVTGKGGEPLIKVYAGFDPEEV